MDLIKVQSNWIEQIGFDEKVKISLNQQPMSMLRIVFKDGVTFDYYNVEKETYEDFLNAKSVGSYFHKYIKNQYTYEKKG